MVQKSTQTSGYFDFMELLPDSFYRALAGLSDAEIEALEDDLDFYTFTGLPSARINSILAMAADDEVLAA